MNDSGLRVLLCPFGTLGEIQPAIAENVVFSLKAGEVGPVIDMGFGFHVVKVVERDYAGLEPLDEKCQAKIDLR